MNSFISWIGGKKLLRKQILEQFPDQETYDRYVEVFGGAGWILFSKDKHANLEVFNDVNGNLINLYRCVKYHCGELQRELEWMCTSREQLFDCMDQINVGGLTDIQRAAGFYVMIKNSFGTDLRSFGVRGRDWNNAVQYMSEVQKRLNRVVIENNDFQQILKTYDRSGTLFYLDPPYYEAEKYYPDRFNPEDHKRLFESLCGIKGKFILSYNDCQEIRDLYTDYTITSVERHDNLVNKTESRKYNELIIKNF